MIRIPRIDRAALSRLLDAPTFSPTDCPNFLSYASFEQYRWYARLLTPLLLATRGGPLFIGHRVATLRGHSPGETWMLVRYPDHRAMLKMIANPYYAFVNHFRERGTAHLELAFTEPRDPQSGIERQRWVLGVHARTGSPSELFAGVRTIAERRGLAVVYESEQRLTLDFLVRPRANDPNPLTYPITTAIGCGTEGPLRDLAEAGDLTALLDDTEDACVQLYRRGRMRDYLRFGRRRSV